MKVKLFTHDDLDGVGCGILGIEAFGRGNIDIEYCSYSNIDEKVNDFLDQPLGEYEMIFITDISVKEDIANRIDFIYHNSKPEFLLLDHHETAKWLNKYEWADVYFQHFTGENTSGTSMFLEYLARNEILSESEANKWQKGFVEKVRRYDSWDWANIYNDIEPKHMNDLFWMYEREEFIDKVFYKMNIHGEYIFNDKDEFLLKIEDRKIQSYIEKCNKNLTIKNVGRYNVGVVFGENYISEVCHALHDTHPELDLISMIDMNSGKVSYRTNRDDINVSEFAKFFGGGGRAQTAGSQVEPYVKDEILSIIFR